ncbi:hypothetical protein NHL50_15420 [Acidimicrobiia bacterium EGI L10123]|uniref:SRPBCC family protein n=1 Tax=Salinilacustrithrix flava TaxID=2957203 RepID=UPI003D7C160C|nr:hypothetical protein [Acidimicrobiia bacterium EGI L10123]
MSHHDGGRLRTDRTYLLDEPLEQAWGALAGVDEYQRWWPWLRRFDGRRLAAGECWAARIRVPMPWSLQFTLHIDRVEPPRQVDATLAGDIEGTATVTLAPGPDGAEIRLRSDLAPRHRLLRGVNRVVPGVSRRLHDRVVDRAFRQFAERDRGEIGPG